MEGDGVRRKACVRCQKQRKKCQQDCMFAPYFPAGQDEGFANVHKVFGANNFIMILQGLQENQRAKAASSMVYEANSRVRDPVNGCFGEITTLQQEVQTLRSQLVHSNAEVEHLKVLLELAQSNRNPSPQA